MEMFKKFQCFDIERICMKYKSENKLSFIVPPIFVTLFVEFHFYDNLMKRMQSNMNIR